MFHISLFHFDNAPMTSRHRQEYELLPHEPAVAPTFAVSQTSSARSASFEELEDGPSSFPPDDFTFASSGLDDERLDPHIPGEDEYVYRQDQAIAESGKDHSIPRHSRACRSDIRVTLWFVRLTVLMSP